MAGRYAEEKSFSSCCHGAGRVLSRSKARKIIEVKCSKLNSKEKYLNYFRFKAGLTEEAPQAYKDVDRVVEYNE